MDNTKKTYFLPAILILAAVAAAFLGILCGSAKLSALQVLKGLLRTDPKAIETQIIWIVRLPHVAACALAGIGLSVSGVLLQTATDNPLAGPNIIGVNAGAGFAVVLGMVLAPMTYRALPLIAFAGAFICTVLIVLVAEKAGGSRITLILAGVALSTLLNAGISLIRLLFPDIAIAYNYFSVGGVSGVTFHELLLPAVIIAASLAASVILSGRLNLLCLGDAITQSLGFRAKRMRMLALLIASSCAAAAVSFAGLLGFVGLMTPHIARRITLTSDLRKLIPVSALLGSTMVTLADLLGRILFVPSEIPAGIITAFIGAPFFFILLLQRRNRL